MEVEPAIYRKLEEIAALVGMDVDTVANGLLINGLMLLMLDRSARPLKSRVAR